MDSKVIRTKFIDYFTKVLEAKHFGHVFVPSSPVVPEAHPTLLFTNSGMVQFTPYFLGKKDPVKDFNSKRIVNYQKVIRTVDLDKVGISKYHLTFFEMLGSWSIGDYGKKEAVEFAFDLLTNKDYGYGLNPDRFYPTVFGGNKEVGCDVDTINAWKTVGIDEKRISKLPVSENWWTVGGYDEPGPCGPCTEILYDRGEDYGPYEEVPGLTDNPRYLEIWNAGVFMEYYKDPTGKLNRLDSLSVDTGAGLERFAVLLQNVDSVYETDLFTPIVQDILKLTSTDVAEQYGQNEEITSSVRRIADHVKAMSFIISENVHPSNKEQGYVLRKLIRSSFSELYWTLKVDSKYLLDLIPTVVNMYSNIYSNVDNPDKIKDVIREEHVKYEKISDHAKKMMKKAPDVTEFDLYQSAGAPKELIQKLFTNAGRKFDEVKFEEAVVEHQNISKKGAGKKFKGGLSGHTKEEIKLHTATHLLHQALRIVLGEGVSQLGSNITPQRLRFDYSYNEAVSPLLLEEIEWIINEKIEEGLPVKQVSLPKADAEKTGALHFFKEKYGDQVSIYYVGETLEDAWSKEFCGGPHVKNTNEIGKIKITKEEGIGKGVRRIKAVLG